MKTSAFRSLKNFHEEKQDWLFGYFSYDLKNEIEPTVFSKADFRFDGVGFAPAFFFQPKHLVEIIGDELIIHSTENPADVFHSIQQIRYQEIFPPKTKVKARITREEYLATVQLLKEHIANGDLYEVNFCQEFYSEEARVHAPSLFIRLNRVSPAPFACFLKDGARFLLCASPERFLKKNGRKIISQPMKGTIARANQDSDQERKEKLFHDEKERAENVMIVDLVRNDLARIAVPGSVTVDELFGIYTFRNVHQMISTVSATMRDDVHFSDVLRSAFPMGSMTGAPKVMAMQLIDQYESVKRGLFSGSVGFITPEGDFDFNVVIRSILYNEEAHYLSFQAGSAITYDCSPEKEYEECVLKTEGMMRAI
ncbi:MAG: anthranilate synthase component I family protein [Chitinophagales bacterium]